jgi:NADP-dependent 3-hydroxy acid dehydrogenase YdfG
VILIPGLGMIAWGKDKSESRVTAEFYNCAVEVMRGAEAIDEYIALPQKEAFDIEYWLLEEAKLRRMPAEKELARQVVIVIGAGSGIGKETAHRLVNEGAHVVSVDLNREAADSTAKEIEQKYGTGIGVAGSGISGCGPALGLSANITDRQSVREMLDQAILAYGGFDSVCVTAGIFVPSDTTGHIPDEKWAVTFNINVTGSYVVGDEARKTWKEQGLRVKLVLTSSANAVVAKKGSIAYDASKGRGQSSRARARYRAGASRARQRRRAGYGRERKCDVSPGPGHRVPGQVRPSVPGRRGDGIADQQARAILCGSHLDEVADHARRPGGSILSSGQ